jgi:hypothetical protein
MQMLRRFLGMSTAPALLEPFSITFPGGETARSVRASRAAPAAAVADALGLAHPCPVLVIMGGAGKMDSESMKTTRSNIEDGLSRFAEEQQVAIVDGGTTAGVMGLLGFARKRRGYHFPLIGVAPEARVEYPGHNPPTKQAELDPNHSHFVLVDGDDFGAESDLLASLGWALATEGRSGEGQRPILGIVINGGAIVKQEAHARATGTPRFPLLVLEGSGRFADELAAVQRVGASDDPVLQNILLKGTLHVLPMNTSAESMRKWLESFFQT